MGHNKCINKINFTQRSRYLLIILSLIIIGVDQFTKYIVRSNFKLYETKVVINNFWNWTLAYNKGAAFSFLADSEGAWPKIFFGVIAFIVAIWIINYILRKNYSIITGLSLAFILGGAVGNLIDRILRGEVTDFIQWYYANYYWPAFNLADSFICVGVVLMILEGILFAKASKVVEQDIKN